MYSPEQKHVHFSVCLFVTDLFFTLSLSNMELMVCTKADRDIINKEGCNQFIHVLFCRGIPLTQKWRKKASFKISKGNHTMERNSKIRCVAFVLFILEVGLQFFEQMMKRNPHIPHSFHFAGSTCDQGWTGEAFVHRRVHFGLHGVPRIWGKSGCDPCPPQHWADHLSKWMKADD